MPKNQKYKVDEIGIVEFCPRKKSGRISISVRPDGQVRVNYPSIFSLQKAFDFLNSNKTWVLDQQKRIDAHKVIYKPGETIETILSTIKIVASNKAECPTAATNDGILTIYLPNGFNYYSTDFQQWVRKIIVERLRTEAKLYIPSKVNILADKYHFKFNKVFIKNLKSKWGSCSNLGNININLHIMRLPEHLIDYIILHELAHTKVHNHGAQFWALLNQLTNNKAKQLDKEMNKYKHIIHF